MFNDYILKLSEIEKRMNLYYETDYINDEDDSKENIDIKIALLNLIIEANRDFKNGFLTNCEYDFLLQKTIDFYRENTGCIEDLEILKKILTKLLDLKLIGDRLVDDILNDNSTRRWR